mmetsp:Transcript_5282/g.14195  ORF Transcript_5282/g.14195 Transcript_5282/m.14195 type:complete len:207 (+) Transcript_5282:1577-2197(+)
MHRRHKGPGIVHVVLECMHIPAVALTASHTLMVHCSHRVACVVQSLHPGTLVARRGAGLRDVEVVKTNMAPMSMEENHNALARLPLLPLWLLLLLRLLLLVMLPLPAILLLLLLAALTVVLLLLLLLVSFLLLLLLVYLLQPCCQSKRRGCTLQCLSLLLLLLLVFLLQPCCQCKWGGCSLQRLPCARIIRLWVWIRGSWGSHRGG